ncbi:MAG: ribonuclease HI family protein [Anaerolineales bacterium]
MTIQQLLEAIAALPEAERRDLLACLRELYGSASAPPPRQMSLDLTEWDGPADYLIVFDGGSQGNPGAGYGSYAIFAGGPGQVARLTFAGQMTNNEAEYHTLLAALRDLLGQLGQEASQASLEVRGDSSLVIEQILGKWKAKDERMRALRDEARGLLNQFKQRRLKLQPRADTVRVLGH